MLRTVYVQVSLQGDVSESPYGVQKPTLDRSSRAAPLSENSIPAEYQWRMSHEVLAEGTGPMAK